MARVVRVSVPIRHVLRSTRKLASRLEGHRAAALSEHIKPSHNGHAIDASSTGRHSAQASVADNAKPLSAGPEVFSELCVENSNVTVSAKDAIASSDAVLPNQSRATHVEDADDWDHQDAGSLDPQAFMRNLAEQNGQDGPEQVDAPLADDEDYHKTVQQVIQCSRSGGAYTCHINALA